MVKTESFFNQLNCGNSPIKIYLDVEHGLRNINCCERMNKDIELILMGARKS